MTTSLYNSHILLGQPCFFFCVARGLDIPFIKTVINFDVAKDIDTHVHRIGRTGRAGEKGTAFTLIMQKDVNFAGDLVRNLVSGGLGTCGGGWRTVASAGGSRSECARRADEDSHAGDGVM